MSENVGRIDHRHRGKFIENFCLKRSDALWPYPDRTIIDRSELVQCTRRKNELIVCADAKRVSSPDIGDAGTDSSAGPDPFDHTADLQPECLSGALLNGNEGFRRLRRPPCSIKNLGRWRHVRDQVKMN